MNKNSQLLERQAPVKVVNLSATHNTVSSVDIGKFTQKGIGNIRAIESANRNEGMKEILKAWDKTHPEPTSLLKTAK